LNSQKLQIKLNFKVKFACTKSTGLLYIGIKYSPRDLICDVITAAPLTWNSLPPAVLNCDSLSTFKSRLKSHPFSTASC